MHKITITTQHQCIISNDNSQSHLYLEKDKLHSKRLTTSHWRKKNHNTFFNFFLIIIDYYTLYIYRKNYHMPTRRMNENFSKYAHHIVNTQKKNRIAINIFYLFFHVSIKQHKLYLLEYPYIMKHTFFLCGISSTSIISKISHNFYRVFTYT